MDSSLNKAYDIFKYYMAVKLYLKGDYDIVKYQGKLRVSRSSFEKRRDRRLFASLSKKSDVYNFVLANLLDNKDMHVSSMLDSRRSEEVYINWIKREESRSHFLENDLEYLDNEFDENFIMKGDYPYLLGLYYDSKIGIDTLSLMNSIVNYVPYWDKEIKDTVVYPDVSNKIKKTRTFIKYSTDDYAKLVKSKFIKEKQTW